MSAISATIDVDRPATVVFAYATDPSRFSEWQHGVVNGAMAADGDVKVGDLCLTTRRIGFMTRSFSSEVTHVDPPLTWGVRGVDGPVRATVEVIVEPLGESMSRLTIAVDFDGHGIGRLVVPLVIRREARKEMPANLAALKANLDGAASVRT